MSTSDSRLEQSVQEALENARAIAVNDRLNVGDQMDFYEVTHSDATRLRMAVNSTIALIVFVAGVLMSLANIWLFRTGMIHWAQLLPPWGKGAIIGLPIIGLLAIFMVGRSIEFTRPRIEKRRLWFLARIIEPSQVAAIRVLQRPSSLASDADHVEVALMEPSGAVALALADEDTGGQQLSATLTLVVQLHAILDKPVKFEGHAKEVSTYAAAALARLKEKVSTP